MIPKIIFLNPCRINTKQGGKFSDLVFLTGSYYKYFF